MRYGMLRHTHAESEHRYGFACVFSPHRDRGVKSTRVLHVSRRVTWEYGNATLFPPSWALNGAGECLGL
ncbi:hypothetical protein EBZ39_04915 [bacterium]|nr:hypothetical protein [bacterium]